MNSVSGVGKQISALADALQNMKNETPSDDVAIEQTQDDIATLQDQMTDMIARGSAGADAPASYAALGAAIDQLNAEINASAGANVLLQSLATIMKQ